MPIVSNAYPRMLLAQRIRRYHQLRNNPRHTRYAPVPYSYSEDAELIRLAEIWLPFGSPPDEEIFNRFGITAQMFQDRLHRALEIV